MSIKYKYNFILGIFSIIYKHNMLRNEHYIIIYVYTERTYYYTRNSIILD